jgi:beta-N-acetylhexosaminidase
MSVQSSLAKPPFALSAADIDWVARTRDGMSTDAKLRQLFVHLSIGDDPGEAARLADFQPGGIHRIMGPDLASAWAATRLMLERNEIPLLITGDIEGGGHGSAAMLRFPNPLGLAAANDLGLSERLLDAVCAEIKALGYNWSFTPVVDVNHEPASAIVGTRSYGSSIETIRAQAGLHVRTLQRHGIAATAKHWPGEGYDARDQHLVTTVNPLSVEDWERTFGGLYRSLIAEGVMSVMSAHIALPSFAALLGVPDSLERYRPASLSWLLNQALLREHLGFNGLIVSDATPMAGFGSWAPRDITAPEAIEAGCDMFLFANDPEADLKRMQEGLRSGRLSEQRLEDAVTRILGLKAAMGLHRKSLDERLPPLEQAQALVNSKAHRAVAAEVAGRSITLVKDTVGTLPLDPKRHRRIVLVSRGAAHFFPAAPRQPLLAFEAALEASGFELRPFDPANPPTRENTDLLLYALATESSLGQSHIFIDWAQEHAAFHTMMERYWHDLPTVMVSFGHPYALTDAPRVPTYINAYSSIEAAQSAVVARLIGAEPFTGQSPVDAFANAPEARF